LGTWGEQIGKKQGKNKKSLPPHFEKEKNKHIKRACEAFPSTVGNFSF
jgi:hypothetical protein